jgi:hypothetical protein
MQANKSTHIRKLTYLKVTLDHRYTRKDFYYSNGLLDLDKLLRNYFGKTCTYLIKHHYWGFPKEEEGTKLTLEYFCENKATRKSTFICCPAIKDRVAITYKNYVPPNYEV